MTKIEKKAIILFVIASMIITMLTSAGLGAPTDFTVTVSTDRESVKPGDIVSVKVTVEGAQFCAAQVDLTYDAETFEYVSTMSGWMDRAEGKLTYLSVKGSDGYWEAGKVIGTLKFMVKDSAHEGETEFRIGENSDVFVVGDWAEGASDKPAEAVPKEQLKNAKVTVENDGSSEKTDESYGAKSDDGMNLNMETGQKVYTIADTEEEVVWQSEDESVVTVDKNGLVTAVSDGSAVLIARDGEGNEIERRTVTVGDGEATPEKTDATEQGAKAEEPAGFPWGAVAATIAVIACAVIVVAKKKRNK